MPLGPQLLEGMKHQRFLELLSEVAAVGQGGLQINEPGTSRSLRPCRDLEGSSPGLSDPCGHEASDAREDSGLEIGAEYEEAVRLHGAGGRRP